MGSCAESVVDHEIIEVGAQIVKGMNYLGLANVQFKRDVRSKRLRLLEINPRFNLWGYLGTYCGVNFPARIYRDLTGQATQEEPLATYPTGVRWIFFKNDLKAFWEYRARGEWSLLRWVRSYGCRFTFHLFSWKDPLPALYSLMLFARGHVKRLLVKA
jgi:predicted ATP-grasp superfamily ATP-dependent carboligase